MKKQRIIGIVLLVVAGLLITGTGVVVASGLVHGRTPFNQDYGQSGSQDYYGPMGGFSWQTDQDGEFPQMMTAMIEAVAEKTGLTVDEIQAKLLDGENLYTIASDAGMTDEEYDQLMDETHDTYFEQYQDQFRSSDRFDGMQGHMWQDRDEHDFGYGYPYNGDESSNDFCPGMPFDGGR